MKSHFAQMLAVSALLLGGAAHAAPSQVDLPCAPAQSAFVASGTSSLGSLVGNGTNLFHVNGHVLLEFIPSPGGTLYARVVNFDAITVEDIHLKVQAPPLVPSAATVDVENLRIVLDSNAFLRAPGGQFDCQVFAHITGGHVTVTLLSGPHIDADLAGTTIGAVARTGGLNPGSVGAGVVLELPLDFDIDLTPLCQPLGSAFGLHLSGAVLAKHLFPQPATYCVGTANSLGCTAAIDASGTASVTAGSGFVVGCQHVRNHTSGLLFYGVHGRATLPFEGGTMCAQLPITRTPLRFSGGSNFPVNDCSGTFALDFNTWIAQQSELSPVRSPGTQANAQWWSRDAATTNGTVLSNALEFTIGL